MRVLVTGANGFIGKNLLLRLREKGGIDVVPFTREHSVDDLTALLDGVDWVYHLAGINRPQNLEEFVTGNTGLTEQLCAAIKAKGRQVPIVYTSSIQAEKDNDYGNSKRAAEEALLALKRDKGNPVYIYRLPNVFGKWAKPNYNSVVATFCHNVAHGLPVKITEPQRELRLVYIDDVVEALIDAALTRETNKLTFKDVPVEYKISLVELAKKIRQFPKIRSTSTVPPVGFGIDRALYSTYLSYIPYDQFKYEITSHHDERGSFVEFLKTSDSGQFSFFSAEKGVTRGGHYHHTKNEKFLVIKGRARFRLRNLITNEKVEITVSDKLMEVVDMPPGWTHDITNIGDGTLLVMLWANEIFDSAKPDTIHSKLEDI